MVSHKKIKEQFEKKIEANGGKKNEEKLNKYIKEMQNYAIKKEKLPCKLYK